jgi:cobalt-zinc-cadmium efflux system protein
MTDAATPPEAPGHDHSGDSGHSHGHSHGAGADRHRLAVVLGLSCTVLVVELAVGLAAGSLALLADAGHVAVDAGGLALALIAVVVGSRPSSATRTFGLARVEVLGTAAMSALLGALAVVVAVDAVRRLAHPPAVAATPVLAAGLLGLAANAAAIAVLHGGSGRLAMRGARLEVLSDLFGATAVVTAGILLATAGMRRADPIASLVVAALVAPRAATLLRETIDVLLQSTPRGLDLAEVRRHLEEADGVVDVHDLHAWSVTSGHPVLSAHVVVADEVLASGNSPQLLDTLSACLAEHFDVGHVTIQLEPSTHAAHEADLHA